MGDALPGDSHGRHGIDQGGVGVVREMLVLVAHELQRGTAHLPVERFLLLLGLVDVLDVPEVGGNAEGDEVIRRVKQLLDAGNQLVEGRRVLHHGRRDAVNLLGAVPLFLVERLDQRVHQDIPHGVHDGHRDDLVVVVHAGQLQVKEQHAGAVHVPGQGAVGVALGAAVREIRLKAVAAELALVADALPARHAGERAADGGAPVIEADGLSAGALTAGDRLLSLRHIVAHAIQPFARIPSARGCLPGVHFQDCFAAVQRPRFLLLHKRSVPQLRRRLGDVPRVVVVHCLAVLLLREGDGCACRRQVHPVEQLRGQIAPLLRFLCRQAGQGGLSGSLPGGLSPCAESFAVPHCLFSCILPMYFGFRRGAPAPFSLPEPDQSETVYHK